MSNSGMGIVFQRAFFVGADCRTRRSRREPRSQIIPTSVGPQIATTYSQISSHQAPLLSLHGLRCVASGNVELHPL
jgi:hypothetical protein